MTNSCFVRENRCVPCPVALLETERSDAGLAIDAAVNDPAYAHLKGASVSEVVGMASQTTERFGQRHLAGVVAGGLSLVAAGICER